MSPIYRIGHSLFRRLAKGLFYYEVLGRENLIEDRGCLVASNHASYLDPPLVGIAFDREIHYLARNTLFRGFGAWLYPRWNSIPVDQENPEVKTIKTVIRLLKQGERVVVFPEGQRSFDDVLQPGQPGVGLMVSKARVPVLPVRIFGAHEALPRGAGRFRRTRITVAVGEPLDFNGAEYAKGGGETYQRIADEIMAAITRLED